MRTLLASCALALAAGACTGATPRSPAPSGEPLHEIHQELLPAAGLQPLRTMVLPADEREVRIWIDVAVAFSTHLYRFRIRGNDVTGESVETWPASPPDREAGERPGETTHDMMLYYLRGSCEGFRRREGYGACRRRFEREPDWKAVLDSMEAAGLWHLPDQSTLPPDGKLTLDGWGMRVELRSGASYRGYGYDNPNSKPWPEAAQALRIVSALAGIDSLIEDPDVLQVHRGVTPGRYGSEFRPCGSRDVWGFEADAWDAARKSGTRLDVQAGDSSARLYVEVRGELSPAWLSRQNGEPYPRMLDVAEVLRVAPWTGSECGAAGPPRGLPAGRR